VTLTLSDALNLCLADNSMSADQLAQCVLNRGFSIGGKRVPFAEVIDEITYLQTHNTCSLDDDAVRGDFVDHIGRCLATSDPIHHYTLLCLLAQLIPPRGLNPLFNPPP